MSDVAIQKQEAQEMENVERTRSRRVFVPKVDIYETDDTVVLLADMPGVDEETVDVTLEKNILTIDGRVDNGEIEGYGLAYREYRVGDYHRTFALSDEVDRNGIEAIVKDGVLKLNLKKSDIAKTRKIAVKAA